MKKNIWIKSTKLKTDWVKKFKQIFTNQDRKNVHTLFNVDTFGMHNGMNYQQYLEHEFNEFSIYSKHFTINSDDEIKCFELGDDYFYFSIGDKKERALFEGVYIWCSKTNKAIGNSYLFKIEPKMQFIKKGDTIQSNRRINISCHNDTQIPITLIHSPHRNQRLSKEAINDSLSDNFYHLTYNSPQEDRLTFWEEVTIYSKTQNKPIKKDKFKILMRGMDHPLFINNLFPIIKDRTLTCPTNINNLYSLYVLLNNGEEFYYKHPKVNNFIFTHPILTATITDSLGFDWINLDSHPTK